jgi:prophage regulatory protein
MPVPNRVLKLRTLLEKVPCSRATIYRGVKNGTFPAPIQLGRRSVGWRESDVDAWIESREPACGAAARDAAARAAAASISSPKHVRHKSHPSSHPGGPAAIAFASNKKMTERTVLHATGGDK